MKLQLEFENINSFNGDPKISICVNGTEFYNGPVVDNIDLEVPDVDAGDLEIKHYGKNDQDTEVIDGVIVNDKNFSLKRIIIDGYDLEDLKWESVFTDNYANTIPGCLFFGPNGMFKLSFKTPILKWILSTRHLKNNNDPNWQEDYDYYVSAVKLLEDLS